MTAYYNEFDPFAAQWLRNMIDAGHIPAGHVDERSILDIHPGDLDGYDQCHFFAGIGVWPLALRRVGWPDNKPIWTGSCPCQPFSAAGRGDGFDDERHLWPAWFHLITQCRPAILAGEQVASALEWFDLVQGDLEGAGYAVGASDLCAAGFAVETWQENYANEWLLRALRDCPDPVVAGELRDFALYAGKHLGGTGGAHIRQRLYFVGMDDAPSARHSGAGGGEPQQSERGRGMSGMGREAGYGVGDALVGSDVGRVTRTNIGEFPAGNGGGGPGYGMDDPERAGLERLAGHGDGRDEPGRDSAQSCRPVTPPSPASGTGAPAVKRGDVDWLFSRDGRWRPVEPGTFPLANAIAGRNNKLRAIGNALDFETVVNFVAVVKELVE